MNTSELSMEEAKSLLDEYCVRFTSKPASAKTVAKRPFQEAAARDWWFSASDTTPVDSPRTRALLLAYLKLGGDDFPLTGIPLRDGYLRPDAKVMRSLVLAGRIAVRDGRFYLTDAGRASVAAFQAKPETAAEIAQKSPKEKDGLNFGRSGEGENHRSIRLWVAANPDCISLDLKEAATETEYVLPSADRIDVLCSTPVLRVAVEVKSRDSNEADLARGIYQCVKYRAVLRAATMNEETEVRACLVTELPLPTPLQAEADRLFVPTIIVPADRSL